MNKKLIIAGIILIIILAVGMGFWRWKNIQNIKQQQQADNQQSIQLVQDNNQSADETASWQIFNNDKIGISLKVPIDWESKVANNSDKSIIGEIKVERKGIINGNTYTPYGIVGGDYGFIITARDNKSDNAKNFENYLNNPAKYSSKISLGDKVYLQDGTIALRNVIEGPGKTLDEQRGNNITYAFEKNNMYYEINIIYDGNGMSGGIGEKILATLKFIE